jgi:hypothetical protein
MITSREEGRATAISAKENALDKFEVPPDKEAKLEGFIAAFNETISLARAHELVMDEMRIMLRKSGRK